MMMFDRITEFVKLIPRVLSNPDVVVKGIINDVKFNYGALPEQLQEEIVRRRLICFNCPFNSIHAPKSEEYAELYNGVAYKTDRVDLHCAICACNVHWKTAVLEEKCGLNYYNDLHPDKKQELKWTEFKNQETDV